MFKTSDFDLKTLTAIASNQPLPSGSVDGRRDKRNTAINIRYPTGYEIQQ